ncbi:hypothetical protein ATN88_22740 [Enterovibrio coralii]|uniref:Uncharacterized protein n=1 Tax=Enterovibrio coralii TaxID=294935 RepID=A0A135I3Z5_9GAMM|nr:hypothetical protein ATN88_22740 [Enterovibrio coralii]
MVQRCAGMKRTEDEVLSNNLIDFAREIRTSDDSQQIWELSFILSLIPSCSILTASDSTMSWQTVAKSEKKYQMLTLR